MSEFKVGDRVVLIPLPELPAEKKPLYHKLARRGLEEEVGPPPWQVSAVYGKGDLLVVSDGREKYLAYFSWRFKLTESTQMELF